jgi:hypothetical protein
LLLCGLLFVCSQGSLTIIASRPAAARHSSAHSTANSPTWERWCTRGIPREDRIRLAFCARVDGRVLGSTVGPGQYEAHLALLSHFHLVLVRIDEPITMPGRGARVIAIGPLFRARDGQREVQAFRLEQP